MRRCLVVQCVMLTVFLTVRRRELVNATARVTLDTLWTLALIRAFVSWLQNAATH